MNGSVNVPGVSYPEFEKHTHSPENIGAAAKDHTHTAENIGAAAKDHGNHVPATEEANNARFLRNDNTWQAVTPENIGAVTETRVTTMINDALGVIENGTY